MKILNDPRLIFKFHSVNPYLLDSLNESTIRFSSISEFNDPFESNFKARSWNVDQNEVDHFYSHIFPYTALKDIEKSEHESIISSRKNSPAFDILFLQDLERSIRSFYSDFYGVACFSEKYDNKLMWGHYADSGRGVCQIFNRNELFYNSGPLKPKIINVNYSEEIPSTDIQLRGTKIHFDLENIITSKRVDWNYENEVRAIVNFSTITPSIEESRDKLSQKNGYMRNLRYNPNKLEGIIFGHKCEEKSRNQIIESLKTNPNIKFEKLTLVQITPNHNTGQYFFKSLQQNSSE